MRTTPVWRDTRLQSLVVMALLVIGALVVVADTLLFWRAEASMLALYEERTVLLEGKASPSPAHNDALQTQVDEGEILLDAQTSGLVSAEFQRLLSNRVETVGAVIRRVDVPTDGQEADMSDPELESLERIRVTADIEVMEQSLPDLMYAIEAGSPVMVVDSFRLRLNRKIDTSWGDQVSTSMDRPLSLNITLSGFREKEPRS